MAGREHTKGWERFAQELGDNITRARESRGLSQEKVASAAGLSRHTYQRLEKGFKSKDEPINPTLYTILAVCRVLGVHVEDILPSYSGSIFT
ncbi:MAG: helix-turn-helix transcriptional regulator, partial [Scrofimicrobium sp.]